MRGRRTPGPEFVQRLEGSELAKRRAEAILKTLAKEWIFQEASAALGISTQRLHEMRAVAVQAMIASQEPQRVGRPPKDETVNKLLAELRAEVARLQQELAASRLREEIAAALPGRRAKTAAPKKNSRPR